MTGKQKLVAGTTAAALLVGGGGAIAAVELGSSHSSPARAAYAAPGDGIGSFDGGPGPGFRRFDGGSGPGPGFRGFDGGRGGLFGSLDAAATYLGVSASTLSSDLAGGKTLAQVAKAQGKTADGLAGAMVAAQKKQLDAAVAAGRLSQAQEQAIVSNLTQRITGLVNGKRPTGGFGGPGFGGGDDGGGGLGGGSGSFGSSGATA